MIATNKTTKEEGLFPLPFLFLFFYTSQSAFGLRLRGRQNVAEIVLNKQAEGGKIK